jgi:hypothetical protein
VALSDGRTMSWDRADVITSVFVNIAVLLGAVGAAIKFRLFNVLSHKWQSELTCRHHVLKTGQIIFEADYTVRNFGQRPLRLDSVRIRLLAAKNADGLMQPDDSRCFATRDIPGPDRQLAGNLDVQPGERTIFTLRCLLEKLDEVVFVVGTLSLPHRRIPAVFRALYIRDAAPPQKKADDESKPPRSAA